MGTLKTRDIPNVEILSVGSWHGTGCPPKGCTFTIEDLDALASAASETTGQLDPPVKLGHTDDQQLLQLDGLPAAGWLANVRRVGDKLLADLKAVPGKIADLIDAGAYLKRSIELGENMPVGEKTYPSIITGLALLGADLPAVENLSDITALYKRAHLSLDSKTTAVLFEASPRIDFALPGGMSYDDLTSALRSALAEANPGAGDDVWVSDLYEDSAIFCIESRYWQQGYSVDKKGAVTVAGMPVEVQRMTTWQAMKRKPFADDGRGVLADLVAFTKRAQSRAEFRTGEGRTLSKDNRELLERLAASAGELQADLERLLSRDTGEDFRPAMRSALIQAELSMAALGG